MAGSAHTAASFCPVFLAPQSYNGDGRSNGLDWVVESERAFLVGVQLKQQRSKYGYSVLESIDELGRLAETAGLEVGALYCSPFWFDPGVTVIRFARQVGPADRESGHAHYLLWISACSQFSPAWLWR